VARRSRYALYPGAACDCCGTEPADRNGYPGRWRTERADPEHPTRTIALCDVCAKLTPNEAGRRILLRRAYWAKQRLPAPPSRVQTLRPLECWQRRTPAGLAIIERCDSGYFARVDGTALGYCATLGEARLMVEARVRDALAPRRRSVGRRSETA
jgi:hypothetical protein